MSANSDKSKRRLSNGGNFLESIVEDEDSDQTFRGSDRKSFGGRRRSSIGTKNSSSRKSPLHIDPEKQQKLAQMYSKIIQMSAENKINDKNSWNLDLIDHMGELIRNDTNNHGINFQRASCTIEASVKIYTHRVDDTYNSSLRIISNLRGNMMVEDAEQSNSNNDSEDETDEQEKTISKPKRNHSHTTKTIETDIKSLSIENLESEHIADPLFHKMSKAFDEGGAKGMLMANMRVSPLASILSFNSSNLSDKDLDEGDVYKIPISKPCAVDVTDLITFAGFTAEEIMTVPVCPTLDSYRSQLGIPTEVVKIPPPLPSCAMDAPQSNFNDILLSETGRRRSSILQREQINLNFEPCLQPDFDNDDDDSNGGDWFAGAATDHMEPNNLMATNQCEDASDSNLLAKTGTPSAKIDWEAVTARRRSSIVLNMEPLSFLDDTPSEALEDGLGASAGSLPVVLSSEADLAFFDVEASTHKDPNAWVGARHWKYNMRARQEAAGVTVPTEEGNVESAAAGKKKGKKTKPAEVIKFTEEVVPEELFIPARKPKGKSDPTLITAAAFDKMAEHAWELELPVDEKMGVQDLCRLFLRPTVKVAPPGLRHLLSAQIVNNSKRHGSYGSGVPVGDEIVWGEKSASSASNSTGKKVNATSEMDPVRWDLYADYDDMDGGDDDFGGVENDADEDVEGLHDSDPVSEDSQQRVRAGLEISYTGLVKASRVVEKVHIGYAKSAKRINVRRLKADMWRRLDAMRGPVVPSDPNLPCESLAFTPETRSLDSPMDTENSENVKPAAAAAAGISDKDKLSSVFEKNRPTAESMSFQDLLSQLNSKQAQSEVTVSYYFICLLHLANEKTLKIAGDGRMSDLQISKDS